MDEKQKGGEGKGRGIRRGRERGST